MARRARRAGGGDARTPLFERERELTVCERAIARLQENAGSMLLVEGPAGIGKTRLLHEAAELATRRDAYVRAARAAQLERDMPFGVSRQLLEPVVERASDEERSRLLTGSAELALMALGREGPEGASLTERDPFAPIHGLYWLLANLSEERPTVLVIDDAHWSDPQTLRWLEYLARRLTDVPALVIMGVRSGEADEPAELAPLRLEAEVLRPAPLSPRAIAGLIAAELPQPTPKLAEACARVTGGNPFLMAEVLRTLRANSASSGRDAVETVAGLGPENIARYVLMRLGRFGEDAVTLARGIAVLGNAPQLRHAANLADLDHEHALVLCDRLREAEILAPGRPIEFVHPLVRSAIYNEYPEGERSSMHRKAAGILAEAGAAPDQVASHLIACAPNGDQWVVAQLAMAAAEAIRAGAFDAAAAYFERALTEPPDDELPFRFGLGMCLIQTDLARAPEVLSDVAQAASDPGIRVQALRYTALAHLFGGDHRGAAHWFSEALDALPEDDGDERRVAEAQVYFFRAGVLGRETQDSRRLRAVAADVEGQTQGECLLLQALAFDRFLDCDPVDEVVNLADSFPPPPWDLSTLAPVAGLGPKILAWSGEWGRAREGWSRLLEWSREQGMMFAVSYAMAMLAETERLAGNLPDAEAAASTALELAGQVAPLSSDFAMHATTNLLTTLVLRGDLDAAERVADGVALSAGIPDGAVTPFPVEARGYLRLARGNLAAGIDDLLVIGEELIRRGDANPALSPWCQEVAPAMAAIGRGGEATTLLEQAEKQARAFGAAHVIGTVLRSRALLEPQERRIRTLRQSIEALERYGPPHELARSLLELGAALRRNGRRSDSRDPLRRGLELAHRCGAGGLEGRAREELAAAGARPRSVFRTGLAALTASELRTAKLAAQGLGNVEIAQRLFVSRRTVEKHLTNAYAKLEIGGRDELAAVLDASELAPGTKK